MEPEAPPAKPLPLLARARDLLHGSSYACVRRLICEVEGDTVVLRGALPSFYIKQVAQERLLAAGLAVRNLATVESPS